MELLKVKTKIAFATLILLTSSMGHAGYYSALMRSCEVHGYEGEPPRPVIRCVVVNTPVNINQPIYHHY